MTDGPHPLPDHQSGGEADFLQIRPEVVRALGGGNAALVYTLIEFRCRVVGVDRVEDSEGRWWRATYDKLAAGTGLTVDQIRRTLSQLHSRASIESVKHRAMGPSDQMLSYRAAPLPAIQSNDRIDSADRPNGRSDAPSIDRIDSVNRPNHHSVNRPNVSSSEELKEVGGATEVSTTPAALPTREEPPPPLGCARHPQGTSEPCRACGDARTARRAWDDRREQRSRAERVAVRAAADACPYCEHGTRVEPPSLRIYDFPAIKCDHTPMSEQQWLQWKRGA